MENKRLIDVTIDFVKSKLEGEGSGHDWWHVYRVWKLAKTIGGKEGGNSLIIELGALLHDIADWKFTGGDETIGPKIAGDFLLELGVDIQVISEVQKIIKNISYKGAGVATPMGSLEGDIVQDADRMDAIGAIGIARTFAYGGYKEREIYNPEIKPEMHQSFDAYKKSTAPTINHFYEKLLLLKDRMNTETAKTFAIKRHEYMEEYLDQFYKEWEGES